MINKDEATIENTSEFQTSLSTKTNPNIYASTLQIPFPLNTSSLLIDPFNYLNEDETYLGIQHMYEQPCKM